MKIFEKILTVIAIIISTLGTAAAVIFFGRKTEPDKQVINTPEIKKKHEEISNKIDEVAKEKKQEVLDKPAEDILSEHYKDLGVTKPSQVDELTASSIKKADKFKKKTP